MPTHSHVIVVLYCYHGNYLELKDSCPPQVSCVGREVFLIGMYMYRVCKLKSRIVSLSPGGGVVVDSSAETRPWLSVPEGTRMYTLPVFPVCPLNEQFMEGQFWADKK